jgi:steroid delta-isomerase-like uncharacterized protein
MAHKTREVKTEVNSEQPAARKAILDLFDRRQEAFDNLDAAMLAADYAENCSVESPYAGAHVGRAAAEEVFRGWFEAFLDLKMRSKELVIDGDRVAQVFEVEGTDLGGFLGLPPTGKAFRVPAVFLYELKGQQIVRERRIYDFTGVMVQIGVLKAKPI